MESGDNELEHQANVRPSAQLIRHHDH